MLNTQTSSTFIPRVLDKIFFLSCAARTVAAGAKTLSTNCACPKGPEDSSFRTPHHQDVSDIAKRTSGIRDQPCEA